MNQLWQEFTRKIREDILEFSRRGLSPGDVLGTLLGQAASWSKGEITKETFLEQASIWWDAMKKLDS